MQKVSYKIVIISLSSPITVGVYRDDNLIQTIESEKKTSDALLPILKDIVDRYDVEEIIYANGPGSYMAIKLTYIMLQTIHILRAIPIKASSAFEFNGNQPIKAMGSLYFIKEKETIITKKIAETIDVKYFLPKLLDDLVIEDSNQPDYRLPAV